MAKPTIIIVRQLGGIGDVLALSCVFRGIREKFPQHEIICVTSRLYLAGGILELAEHNPYIDSILVIEPFEATTQTTKSWWKEFAASPRLEDFAVVRKADFVIDLNTVCIETEITECRNFGRVLTPRYKIWCDAAGVVPSSYFPCYEFSKNELRAAQQYKKENWPLGKKVIGVGVAASTPDRSLKPGVLIDVCRQLRDAGCHVVTIDATRKYEDFDYLVGKRIAQLMPLISEMDVVLSMDSGVLHMAGAVSTPVIGIFGPTDYKMRMGQYTGSAIDSTQLTPCAPCWYNYPCKKERNPADHFKCFQKISPSVIVEEVLRWVTWTDRQAAALPLPVIK
jgi:ADP-heptose:LPS heptosyltransferase